MVAFTKGAPVDWSYTKPLTVPETATPGMRIQRDSKWIIIKRKKLFFKLFFFQTITHGSQALSL